MYGRTMVGGLALILALTTSRAADFAPCGGRPADVFFLLDSSGSISRSDFKKELQFTQDVTSLFDVENGKVQVGVLSFSKTVTPQIGLGQYDDKVDLMDKIAAIEYEGYGTNTGAALEYLHEQGLPINTIRPDTPRIAIILTDGQSQNMASTLKESDIVHKSGISVFAIGIGKQVDEEELKAIASEPSSKYVFEVDDFDALNYIKDSLAIRACKVKPITPSASIKAEVEEELVRYGSCTPRNALDVVFAVDTAAIGAVNAKFVLGFIGNVSEHLNMEAGDASIAIIGNGCSGGSFEELPSSNSKSVKEGLAAYQAPEFQSLMRNMRIKASDGRRSSKHVGVVVLGETLSPYEYRQAVLETKRAIYQKTVISVIGVGNRMKESQAKTLAVNGGEFYHVTGYDTVAEAEKPLLFNLCLLGVDMDQK